MRFPILARAALAAFISLTIASAASAQAQPLIGRLMPISQNPALYSLYGTTYGGDGRTSFALPKLAGPTPGLRWCVALVGTFPQRS
jgi:microcystin-dependent protein